MSHTIFVNSILCDARVWAWLHQVDAAEGERCREAGCRHCDGELHSATYPRKPYGLAPALREEGTRRFSYCCAACRRRATPPSVRFFGRRFYVGGLFLLVSALVLRGGVRLETVGRKWRIPVVTLRRWRRWWREAFPATGPWRREAGRTADAARGGAPALRSAADARQRLRGAAVAEPDLVHAVDGLLHARRWPGGSRRKGFYYRRIGRRTWASLGHGEGRCRHGQQQRSRRPRPVGALALCGRWAASGLAAARGPAAR